MKPKVCILGHWNPLDLPNRCAFEFGSLGYAHDIIPSLDVASLGKLCSENDLVIIQDLGRCIYGNPGPLEGWRGGRAKVVLWVQDIIDYHHYLQAKQDLFDGIALAHSSGLKLLKSHAFWVPCSVVFQSGRDFRRANAPRWDFACIARHYPQAERNVFMDRWRECFEAWGHDVFLGEVNAKQLPHIYCNAKTVFNIPGKGDLNMRFFEALAAGATVMMTDCADLHHERFSDLMDAVWITPKTLDETELKQSVIEMRLSNRRPMQKRALENHLLINRYIEIAEKML